MISGIGADFPGSYPGMADYAATMVKFELKNNPEVYGGGTLH